MVFLCGWNWHDGSRTAGESGGKKMYESAAKFNGERGRGVGERAAIRDDWQRYN